MLCAGLWTVKSPLNHSELVKAPCHLWIRQPHFFGPCRLLHSPSPSTITGRRMFVQESQLGSEANAQRPMAGLSCFNALYTRLCCQGRGAYAFPPPRPVHHELCCDINETPQCRRTQPQVTTATRTHLFIVHTNSPLPPRIPHHGKLRECTFASALHLLIERAATSTAATSTSDHHCTKSLNTAVLPAKLQKQVLYMCPCHIAVDIDSVLTL